MKEGRNTVEKYDFFEAIEAQAEEINSRYRDVMKDRRALFEFMEMNDWFKLNKRQPGNKEKIISKEHPFMLKRQDILYNIHESNKYIK